MNAKTHASNKLATSGVLLALTLVIGLTFVSVRRAYAAVAVANVLVTSRVVAAGGISLGVWLPVINQAISVSATVYAPAAQRGTASGAVTRHLVGGFANTISSAFVNGPSAPPASMSVNSGVIGTDICYISPGGVNTSCGLEIGPSTNEIRVENDEAVATTTVISLMW